MHGMGILYLPWQELAAEGTYQVEYDGTGRSGLEQR
jgi:hypothetical protein